MKKVKQIELVGFRNRKGYKVPLSEDIRDGKPPKGFRIPVYRRLNSRRRGGK